MRTILKIIIGIPIITTFIIGIIFIGLGVYEASLGLIGILLGEILSEGRPGLKLFQALDLFLIGFLFLIFSIGFLQLFFPKSSKIMAHLEGIAPPWLHVENFTQLKLILWDTVLTTLVVLFIGDVFIASGNYNWNLTIIPIAILMISLAKFLIKKIKEH
ncbi:YqhA family protein [Aequorivita sp. SDUM287046]|uniref:YqhA family protein n=1 Tax=Aequorivita aurantiaca TaxID=3053356 RepID=A0ABT8DE29_9FLAO|nr:YqhA family protein [Aequorivita aurantiaca]MDN3723542.1 YqhA family protein [Aequorivita aurantiaca]